MREGSPSLAQRLGTHLTIACAVVVTDVGVGLMFGPGESTWAAVAVGTVVFLWLPLSVWLARLPGLPQTAAEGLAIVALGLLVAGAELGLLRGPDRVAQTVVAVFGLLAGWAMRIEPPQPSTNRDP